MKNQNETNEGNKLIAEFMGRKGKVNAYLYWVNVPSVKWVTIEQMQFHTSWDWLMPVVEKIWKITNCSESIFHFTIGYKRYIMPEKNTGKHIEVCWDACMTFIKWYNQNKEL